MAKSFDEALAETTAPGQMFEVIDVEIDGVSQRVFKNAPKNLAEFFAAARGSEETFIVYEDERWSFGQTMEHVDALAAAFVTEFGIQKGDRIGIAMRNLPEWIIAFAAAVSIGAISVSLNAWWTEEEMDYAVGDADLSVLLVDAERLERTRTPASSRGVPLIIVRSDELQPMIGNVHRYEDVVTLGTLMPAVDVEPEDLATILYTSGTTGYPKGAASSHRAIVQALFGFWTNVTIQNARKDEDMLGGGGFAPCFILIVPLFHVTGCVPVMLSAFGMKLKLVMMYRWDPESALKLIERERVTTFVGVPTQSWDLLECPSFGEYDTSSLSSVGGGGAPAPEKLVERVDKSFSRARPNIGYGMTETNAYGPGNTGDDYAAHPSSTGRASTAIMQFEIRDENLVALPVGITGEIWMKSPTLISSYWRKPEATAESIVDGWLRSGDIGRIDEEGFLYIEDRAKDMVLRAGDNVYSAEVESAIYELPEIYEAAVFGVPHERLGEEVACVICLKEGMTLTGDQLREALTQHLANFKIPSLVAFSEDRLPRNPSGKILKRELRSMYFTA